jgi:hypothetical protein
MNTRTISTRPTLTARVKRWLCLLHDRAEIMALQSRIAGLEALEEEVRLEIADLRYVQYSGSAKAAALASVQIKERGEECDQYRNEALRLRKKLALLGVDL